MLKVLKKMFCLEWILYRPKVICIESLNSTDNSVDEYKKWEYIILKNDYEFAYVHLFNRFYFDKRIKGIKDKFKGVNHYINIYGKKI